MKLSFKTLFSSSPRVLPGLYITLGFTLFYLALIVIIPLSGLLYAASKISLGELIKIIASKRVLAAYKVSLTTSAIAALISSVFGFLIAWILVRYNFYGKKIIDALVDLPLAIPTAVAGIALSALYSPNAWLGGFLENFNIKLAFCPAGIVIALIFTSFPLAVRAIEPVLHETSKAIEEAAAILGAGRLQIFFKIILPNLYPALLTSFAMSFARSLGEYGSVIFIAGNIPMFSEVIPLIIVSKLEQYDYSGAIAVASVMLLISFIMLFIINFLQKWNLKTK